MTGPSGPATAETLYRSVRDRFAEAGLATPDLDASLLIDYAAGLTALDRLRDPACPVSDAAVVETEHCVKRRLAGEPAHRIIGAREFYGLALDLNPSTLVPRPDTETLVDLVLPAVRDCVARTGACSVLDLGTGTGAIALAILAAEPDATATATDISAEALQAALSNAHRNELSNRFDAVRSDWFAEIAGQYDVIVSNPPYIRSAEITGLDAEVREHDPRIALDGGGDGLTAYRAIAAGAIDRLKTNGVVGIEIGHDQNADVTKLFEEEGFRKIAEMQDFSGHDRAILLMK
ncbi:peptide chain release factor N(5)-glutamine methyltransferase [Oricola sp.]|uniref:peptide chain release factor N(5)-glutamine methyltransferase n=1 Tax=Oricola sp. TaxID=1979950 RepID=UPI003BAAC9B2